MFRDVLTRAYLWKDALRNQSTDIFVFDEQFSLIKIYLTRYGEPLVADYLQEVFDSQQIPSGPETPLASSLDFDIFDALRSTRVIFFNYFC